MKDILYSIKSIDRKKVSILNIVRISASILYPSKEIVSENFFHYFLYVELDANFALKKIDNYFSNLILINNFAWFVICSSFFCVNYYLYL